MTAYVFPGQGAQFTGMGKDLYDASHKAKELIDNACDILGFDIRSIMFTGSTDDLKQTRVTQPAVFIHSVAAAATIENFNPGMTDGLRLVYARAMAMQKACEARPSTMAAIIGLPDELVEKVCAETDGIVVPANYNCPGQLVISGEIEAVDKACATLKDAGAKRALRLAVGGAFHSPLMEPARVELAEAISRTDIKVPVCPVYQNVDAQPSTDPVVIKDKLLRQLTSPVRWTQTVLNMHRDGATEFVELGPGTVLQGLIKKCLPIR